LRNQTYKNLKKNERCIIVRNQVTKFNTLVVARQLQHVTVTKLKFKRRLHMQFDETKNKVRILGLLNAFFGIF